MKNKIFGLLFVGIYALLLPCCVNAADYENKMKCFYEAEIPAYTLNVGSPLDVPVKTTVQLDSNGTNIQLSANIIIGEDKDFESRNYPTSVNVLDELMQQILTLSATVDPIKGSSCKTGKPLAPCMKNLEEMGKVVGIVTEDGDLKLTFGQEKIIPTDFSQRIIKILQKSSGYGSGYDIIDDEETMLTYFVSDSEPRKYTCPSNLYLMSTGDQHRDGNNYMFFITKDSLGDSCLINDSQYHCNGEFRITLESDPGYVNIEKEYDGSQFDDTHDSNCCVYDDSNSPDTPVYVYYYGLTAGGVKQYAGCVGLNCMTLSPTLNQIMTTKSLDSKYDWGQLGFHNVHKCSSMPSKIYYTLKGKVYERTLNTNKTCEAPTTEPSSVNKTYAEAVIHPTEPSIDWSDPISVNCDGILGEELQDFLNKIFRWIRIIAPIVVIILSSVEFAGALLQDDRDALKKASNRFIKRLIIAVALFFVPLILEFILNVFNEITKSNSSICDVGK